MELFLNNFKIVDLVDILIVSVFVYYILLWFKGSRAFQLVKGILVVMIIFALSKWLGLSTIEWLMQRMATIMLVLLIVVFQPELRRGLERLGRNFLMSLILLKQGNQEISIINKITKAVEFLSAEKLGAIIVFERTTGLSEYLESGLKLDALVSTELLLAVFQKNSPLHDGALIIQEDKIAATCCLLPLTESKFVDVKLGTRHKAAIGLSELTDAFVIVISEETGVISVAENGVLTRYFTKESLKERLLTLYQKEQTEFMQKFRDLFAAKKTPTKST